jgi:hypothetical protein
MKVFLNIVGILMLPLMILGCSEKEEVQIPEYPNAVEDQEHNAEILGMNFGNVRRVITRDSFDKVFSFYNEHLQTYNPTVMSHKLDDGRQAAFTINETEKSSQTVAVQEFPKEGVVAITYMNVDVGL